MTRGRSSNGARTPQVRNEPVPEDGADVLRVRPQGALCYHHDPRPGSAVACVCRAWTAPASPVAIGDGVAPNTPWRYVDPLDGTRRGERAGGDRAGQAPGADTDRAQTHGTHGVVGDHPATALGRPYIGTPGLTRCR